MWLALALCALCAVQWQREASLRREAGGRARMLAEKDQKISALEARLKQWDAEIARLDAHVKELSATGVTNQTTIAAAQRAQRLAEIAAEHAGKQLASHQVLIEQQNVSLKKQNEAITQQNEAIQRQNALIKQLGEERNRLAEQLNQRTREHNAVVEKYNALVKQVGTGGK